MLKRYHHIVGVGFRSVDALVVAASWLLAYWVRFNLPILEITKGFPAFQTYAALTPFIVILWMTVFAASRVYQSRRMLRRTHEVQQLLRAHGTALLLFIALTYLFAEYKYSRAVMLSFGVISAIALVTFRLTLRNLLRNLRRKGRNLRYVLVVGDGQAAQTLIQRLERFPELGLRVLGVAIPPRGQNQARDVRGRPILGTTDQIHTLLAQHPVDIVVLALHRNESSVSDMVLETLKTEAVEVQLIPDLHEYLALGCEVEDFDGLPIVRLNDSGLVGWGALAKRATDFVLAALALLLLSPLLLLVAILVRLSSRGPIFYAQERMGLDGRTFKMYKFRSMRADAETQTGAVWAKPGDDRRTRVGSFLRATSLDELPQFWNVLRGQMSLVGPRPERPVFVHQFKKEIPHYMLRHKVKAGITGWAQINGWRGDTALDKRIEFDLYYIRNWSYALDLKILVLTLFRGFIHKNAY